MRTENIALFARELLDRRFKISDQEVEELAKYFPQNDQAGIAFCKQLLTDFYEDRQNGIPAVIRGITSTAWRKSSEAYLIFFQHMAQDTASLGFPSMFTGFLSKKESIEHSTQRSMYDARNILALRIYLSDLIAQSFYERKKKFTYLTRKISLLKTPRRKKIRVSELANVFGSYPSAKHGRVSRPVADVYLDDADTHRYYFDRQSVETYFPNIEAAEALLKIGTLLGRDISVDVTTKERKYFDRDETFAMIGSVTKDQAEKIFPDIIDSTINVLPAQRKLVELAFGMPYELAREMIKVEFNNDQVVVP